VRKSVVPTGLITLVSVTLVLFAACGTPEVFSTAAGSVEDRPVDWPPFTAVYEIDSESPGFGAQTWELVYEDEWNWTKTLLEDSTDPGAAGTTERFQDMEHTITHAGIVDPKTGEPWSLTVEYPDGPLAPEFWLIKDLDLEYLERGYLVAEEPDQQLLTFEVQLTVPCQDDASAMGTQPETCRTSPTYRSTEETVYTTETLPPLPVKVVISVEENVVTVIEVTKLSVTADESEVEIR
jgi:hypothetical protein